MKLVVITGRYDSKVTKTKIQPTPLNTDGNPMYVIGLSDERAQTLIDAGVAEEYITEEMITSSDDVSVNSNEDSTVADTNTNESDSNADGNPDATAIDESDDSNANDDDTSSADSNDDASSNVDQEETPKETKSNSRLKKNKSK